VCVCWREKAIWRNIGERWLCCVCVVLCVCMCVVVVGVDFIHRVEFEEVSGHRVLIKRGPGNRGPSECGKLFFQREVVGESPP